MRLIGLAVVLALSLFLAPLAVKAQQAGKPTRIGVLTAQSRETSTASWESFRQGLRDLGWEAGKNLVIRCVSSPRAPESAVRIVSDRAPRIVEPRPLVRVAGLTRFPGP